MYSTTAATVFSRKTLRSNPPPGCQKRNTSRVGVADRQPLQPRRLAALRQERLGRRCNGPFERGENLVHFVSRPARAKQHMHVLGHDDIGP